MAAVLAALILLSIFGGIMPSSIAAQFPAQHTTLTLMQHYTPIVSPFVAIFIAYSLWQRGLFIREIKSPVFRSLHQFFLSGWHFDRLYALLFVRPYFAITQLNKADVIDTCYRAIEVMMLSLHRMVSKTQNGSLRLYSASIIMFVLVSIAWLIMTGDGV